MDGRKNDKPKKQKADARKAEKPEPRPNNGIHASDATKVANTAARANSQTVVAQPSLKKAVKAASKVTSGDLKAWLKSASRPFQNPAVQCPVNYNPVPSIISSVATTEYFHTVVIRGGESRQITLFPGHNREIEDVVGLDNMDGTSYHAALLTSRNEGDTLTDYSIGPCSDDLSRGSAIGYISEGVATDELSLLANNSGCRALVPSVKLPYIAKERDGFHTRWKCTGLGLKLVNETPSLNRGGMVESVQPTSKGLPTLFSELSVNPTYMVHEPDTEDQPITISLIHRLQDLAYWHTENIGSPSSVEAGIRVRITAPETDQTWRLMVVAHWQLAGNSLLAIGSPSVHRPMDRAVVEPAIEHLANSSHTAGDLLSVAADVARGVMHGVTSVAELAVKHAPVIRAGVSSLFGGR
jgi:hypothetical protein